jgi:hypothetical protein
MQRDKLIEQLNNLAAADPKVRDRIAVDILDADQTTIRQLGNLWIDRFRSRMSQYAVAGVGSGFLIWLMVAMVSLTPPYGAPHAPQSPLVAILLAMMFACLVLVTWRTASRYRKDTREISTRSEVIANLLRTGARPRHVGRLLTILYMYLDREQQLPRLVIPAADALSENLQLSPMVLRELTPGQQENLRLLLSRARDHRGREGFIIRLLTELAACSAVEYHKTALTLAKTTRHAGIRAAAAACAEQLHRIVDAQRAADVLLRPAESGGDTLLRPVAATAVMTDAQLLRAAAKGERLELGVE